MEFYNSITMGAVTQFKYDITSANLPLMQFLLHTNHECPIFYNIKFYFKRACAFFLLRCEMMYPDSKTRVISKPERKTKRSERGPKKGE